MKIAISANGKTLEDNLDLRFGRALGFIIYDTESKEFKFIDNIQNMNASQGAGIQAGQNVVNENVEAVITGHCGPKAYKILETAKVKVYCANQEKIANVIEKFTEGELEEQTSADVDGHWM